MTDDETQTIIWDFSDFTEKTQLSNAETAPVVHYRDLIIAGTVASDAKDNITAEGIRFAGPSTENERIIAFQPKVDGYFVVQFDGEGKRLTAYLSRDEVNTTGESITAIRGQVSINAPIGHTYYFSTSAAVLISECKFIPV